MIDLIGISKTYHNRFDNRMALHEITVSFPSKGVHSIVGGSGSGKSTLLNIIAGLDTPDHGVVNFDGRPFQRSNTTAAYRNFHIGIVFQDDCLIDELNVYENIKLSLELQNRSDMDERIESVMNKLKIAHLRDSDVNELSGGEKQRVSIARALAKGSKVLLADEPTGNLDSQNADNLFALLRELGNELLVILVTHDETRALDVSDRVLRLESGRLVSAMQVREDDPIQVDIMDDRTLKEGKTRVLSRRLALKRKGRLAFTTLLSMIAVSLFAFSINLSFMNPESILYNNLAQTAYYDIYVSMESIEDELHIKTFLSDLPSIEHSIIYRYPVHLLEFFGLSGTIESRDPNMGRFYSETLYYLVTEPTSESELSPGEVAITDYTAEAILYYANVVGIDPDDLVGLPVQINGHPFVIGAIDSTDYRLFLPLVDDTFVYYQDHDLDFRVKHQYSTVRMTEEDYAKIQINPDHSLVQIDGSEVETHRAAAFHPGWLDQAFPDSEEEIALSYGFILDRGLTGIGQYASVIGTTITLEYSAPGKDVVSKAYTIVGTYDSYLVDIVLEDNEYRSIANEYALSSESFERVLHILPGEESDTGRMADFLYQSPYHTYNILWEGYRFSRNFCDHIQIISLVMGLVFLVLAFGMVGHFIGVFILDNKALVGVLLALGASQSKIFRIFFRRTYIQMIAVIGFAVPMLWWMNQAMNDVVDKFDTSIRLFYISPYALIVVTVLCFLLYFGCTTIPLFRFMRKDINQLIHHRP